MKRKLYEDAMRDLANRSSWEMVKMCSVARSIHLNDMILGTDKYSEDEFAKEIAKVIISLGVLAEKNGITNKVEEKIEEMLSLV